MSLVAVEPSPKTEADDCIHEKLALARVNLEAFGGGALVSYIRATPEDPQGSLYICERCSKTFPDVRGIARGGDEVRGALEDHLANVDALQKDSLASKRLAREIGKSRERMFGYFEGVSWAYRWFLDDVEEGE